MARLEVRLLGGFSLSRDGRPLEKIPLRAARSLLAFLVLNRDRDHTRELLAGTFWPAFDEPRARRRLSQALWHVQASLDAGNAHQYIVGTTDTVRFDPDADIWVDVEEFERYLARALEETPSRDLATVEEAIGLYTGDLLAGFYDDWLFPDQRRLREGFLTALRAAVELAMAKGDHEAAITHARRLAREDEFDEQAHRHVMRAAVLLGRHHEAIKQFDECRRILLEGMGSAPSPETVALYEATLADREAGGRPLHPDSESPLFGDSGGAPFVGRDPERSRMAQLLDEALDGRGSIVLIEGESGVGKTRLLTEVADDARWRGMDVLWGRSAPSGGRPFAPFAEALGAVTGLRARQLAARMARPWLEVLSPLAPALGGTGDRTEGLEAPRRAEDAQRMRDAITAAFQGVAELAPTLLVLEDVHWADDDTVLALANLAERVADARLLIAVSYRHGEARDRSDVWRLLRGLDRLEQCERVSLAPYSPAQTEELIRKSLGLGEVSGEFSERLHRDTGGIPLFIVETLRALYEKDDLAEAEAPAESPPATRDRLPVTPTMHALIRHRLDGLDPESRETLELIAAHDGDLLLDEVLTASALGEETSLGAVDDLLRRRLVTLRDGECQVEHELMRRVVYDDLPLSRRLDLHRRVALAVEHHRPEAVEVLAHHFATARVADRAAHYLERAADHALAVHAYDTAARHLERASATLVEIGAPPQRQFAVAALLEEVLDVLGRREDQEEALRTMERHASDAERSDVHRRRAWWLAHQDRFPEAEEDARLALDVAESLGDGGRAVAALTTAGMIACFAGRAAEGVGFLEQAAELHGADKRQEADARNALGQNLIDLQRFGEAESQLLSALDLYEDLGDARGQAEVLGMLGTLRMERGEPESAEGAYLRAIDLSRRIGYRHGEAVHQMNLAILRVITNRLGDALQSFESAANTYRLMGNRRGLALVQSNAAWMKHSRLGRTEEAKSDIDRALVVYREIGDQRGEAQCLGMLGSIRSAQGSREGARDLYSRALALSKDVQDQWLSAQILREFSSSELHSGFPEDALRWASESEDLCVEAGMEDLIISVRALKGRALLELGRADQALVETTKAYRMLRPGIELAHVVHFSHGLALEHAGEVEGSKTQYERAYRLLARSVADLSEGDRDRVLSTPDNAPIVAKWESTRAQIATVPVASQDVPVGKALESDDYVQVHWTVADPSDHTTVDRLQRRRVRLLRLVREAREQGGAPTVQDLASALGASAATIRRDIRALKRQGHEVTTRGSRPDHQA